MMRLLPLLAGLALVCVTAALGQEPVDDPAGCRAATGDASAITVSHAGRTYYVTDERCRDAFLAEPERYAQLFDALAELEAEGKAPPPEHDAASLVPS